MGKWDGLDRRKFPRVKYPCLVVIKDGNDGEEIILSHTENVGIGGVCVILKKNVKMFSKVRIELDLLDMGKHIKCDGKVVWNVQRSEQSEKKPSFYDVGIEFQGVTDEERARIQEIVGKLVHDRQVPYK